MCIGCHFSGISNVVNPGDSLGGFVPPVILDIILDSSILDIIIPEQDKLCARQLGPWFASLVLVDDDLGGVDLLLLRGRGGRLGRIGRIVAVGQRCFVIGDFLYCFLVDGSVISNYDVIADIEVPLMDNLNVLGVVVAS